VRINIAASATSTFLNSAALVCFAPNRLVVTLPGWKNEMMTLPCEKRR
jgi:hypothetical protein